MSRSKKKPYIHNCCVTSTAVKQWKKECNKKVRRMSLDEDIDKVYKKLSDPWLSPGDGKGYWDDPKGRRK